jgi:hypothetical protein
MGVPVVNIGSRQSGRDRGDNVADSGYDRNHIREAIIGRFQNKMIKPSFVYGGGDAGLRIAKCLTDLPLQFHKKITF